MAEYQVATHSGYRRLDTITTLTEVLPQKHGGDQLRVVPPCPYCFIILLQLLLGQFILGLAVPRVVENRREDACSSKKAISRVGLAGFARLDIDPDAHSRIEQFPDIPEDGGVQDGDADRVYLRVVKKTSTMGTISAVIADVTWSNRNPASKLICCPRLHSTRISLPRKHRQDKPYANTDTPQPSPIS